MAQLKHRPAALVGFLALCLLAGCQGDNPPASHQTSDPAETIRQDQGLVAFDAIVEASGLAASRQNPGVLWAHNDSGDSPRLYALGTSGQHLGVYTLAGAQARDWEDMAIGPGPVEGRHYLYVGDIGDNDAEYDLIYVYRVPEPRVDAGQAPVDTTLTGVERISLRYPDGPRNAETLLVDPVSKDFYVATKRSTRVNVYRAPFPQSTTDVVVMEHVTALDFERVADAGEGRQGAVAGDISPSGLAVLLKSYARVFMWSRPSAEAPLFAADPVPLPYVREPQGEGIAWSADGGGYFTLSEERQDIQARLYFYPLDAGDSLLENRD